MDISNLPPSIVETILCLIPIKEAARTSILSKEWRYKWTKIPKLVIYGHTFDGNDPESKERKVFNAIYQILSNHQGPINEFTFATNADDIIAGYALPLSLLPMHQLKDLYLSRCVLDQQLTFIGFSSLTSLYMDLVYTSTEAFEYLLSNCPLLKRLTLNWMMSYHIQGNEKRSIINLFRCLQAIESLTIPLWVIRYFAQDMAPHRLPTPLVNLKYLCLKKALFIDIFDNFPFVAFLIRSSPYLEQLRIQMAVSKWETYLGIGSLLTIEDYSDLSFEHLNILEILYLSNFKYELDFVKLVLAKSPKLKKVKLVLDGTFYHVAESQIADMFVSCPRASSEVEIIFRR